MSPTGQHRFGSACGNTVVTVRVPETARNFDQIKPGDVVTAKYTQSTAVAVRKSDEPPQRYRTRNYYSSAAGTKTGRTANRDHADLRDGREDRSHRHAVA